MGVDDERSTLVVVTIGAMHLIARRETDATDATPLDVNVGGVHLTYRFSPTELDALPADPFPRSMILLRHGFCPECDGYGIPHDRLVPTGVQPLDVQCPVCLGTGRTAVRVSVYRDGEAVVASYRIDAEKASTVKCNLCRSALTPAPT